ncbi:MAG: hypothetical protein A4E50_01817 [Methanosaeta sp. PtaB.Bin087]|nr:MAG: hypothetical protein A4E50_01817 [Methanosaeta sp. PtaB.Bin087]
MNDICALIRREEWFALQNVFNRLLDYDHFLPENFKELICLEISGISGILRYQDIICHQLYRPIEER